MSLKLASLLFGVSSVLAERNTNDVSGRYAIIPFNEGEFPSAIGFCNPLAAILTGFTQRATCVDEGTLMYELFQSGDCSGGAVSTAYYYAPGYTNDTSLITQSGGGTLYDFNCDEDLNDELTEISFSSGGCETDDDNIFIFYAAINQCTQNRGLAGIHMTEDEYTSISVYCDENRAELQYFDNPDEIFALCGDNFYAAANVSRTCGYMLSTGENPEITVFGALLHCTISDGYITPSPVEEPVEDEASTTPAGDDDDDGTDSSAFGLYTGIAALITTILSAFVF